MYSFLARTLTRISILINHGLHVKQEPYTLSWPHDFLQKNSRFLRVLKQGSSLKTLGATEAIPTDSSRTTLISSFLTPSVLRLPFRGLVANPFQRLASLSTSHLKRKTPDDPSSILHLTFPSLSPLLPLCMNFKLRNVRVRCARNKLTISSSNHGR